MISITNLTKQTTPKISYKKISDHILGKDFDLSLVFAGDKRMRTLNKKWRKKDKIANTLSFPYSKKDGEIFLNINPSKNLRTGYKNTLYLFIHSLLHLKGFKHGTKMEEEQNKYFKKFSK